MATMTGRRWQELQEQLRSGGSRRRSGGDGLFNVDANDIGQRSIFSRTPEINPAFNPNSPAAGVSPYLPTTAAGRRLNVRNVQDLVEQTRMLDAIKGQQEAEIAIARAASADKMSEDTNRINTTTQGNITQLNAESGLRKGEAEDKLVRVGLSVDPTLSPAQAMVVGERILAAQNIAQDISNTASRPFAGKLAEANANRAVSDSERAMRENAARTPEFINNLNNATLASEYAKGVFNIGPGGSVMKGPDNSNTLVNPASQRTIKKAGGAQFDANGKLVGYTQPSEELIATPPSIIQKINLQKYGSDTPELQANLKDNGPTTNLTPNPPQTPTTPATPAAPLQPTVNPPAYNPSPFKAILNNLPAASPFSGIPGTGFAQPGPITAPPVSLNTVNQGMPTNALPTNGLGLLAPTGFENNIKRTILPRAAAAIQELIRTGALPQTNSPAMFAPTNRFGF